MIGWLEKKRYVSIILTLVVAVEIFYFSSIPGGKGVSGGITWLPIAYHVIVFFLFSFFLLISIKGNKEIRTSYILTALALSIIYAISDEFHQFFVPFREATIDDVLTDAVGIFLATIVYLYSKKK
jgi:VanZ family protein